MSKRPKLDPRDYLKLSPHAGDKQPLPTGLITYLAPLPLPTFYPARDYHKVVGAMDDAYLVYGSSRATLFSWQLTLGSIFFGFILFVFLLPLIAGAGALLVGGTWYDAKDFFYNTYSGFLNIAIFGSFLGLLIGLCAWYLARNGEQGVVAPRFNRQRREVCFVPEGGSKAYIVPWESLSAWTTEAQGATQYGVQRQYGLGIGFHDEQSGRDCIVEYPFPALPLAISTWEAVRAYMEYEVHTLEEIHGKDEFHEPGDPPYEGLHTFRNARRRLHRRYREGEVGLWMMFGWYLYHVMTLWTLPAFVSGREALWLQRRGLAAIPKKMAAWSEPLPKDQWAKPSVLLMRQSAAVKKLQAKHPNAPITNIYTEARSQQGEKVV